MYLAFYCSGSRTNPIWLTLLVARMAMSVNFNPSQSQPKPRINSGLALGINIPASNMVHHLCTLPLYTWSGKSQGPLPHPCHCWRPWHTSVLLHCSHNMIQSCCYFLFHWYCFARKLCVLHYDIDIVYLLAIITSELKNVFSIHHGYRKCVY